MKLLVFLAAVALSQANLLEEFLQKQAQIAQTFVDKEQQLAHNIESIFQTLGKRGDVDSLLMKSVLSGLGDHVQDEMKDFISKISDSIDGAGNIITHLQENLQTASEGLKNGQDIKMLAQMVLATLEKDVQNMHEKGTFDVDIDKMIDEIVPNAVAKLMTKKERRGLIGDLLNGFKDTLTDTAGLLSGTAFGDLKGFMSSALHTATSALTPSLGNLKNLAQAFLAHAGQATAGVAMQAVKFFEPFKAQLGSVFTQIQNVAASLTGQ